jgi:uncharacterized protein
MKKYMLLVMLLPAFALLKAQSDYKVVFDLTSKDTVDQQALIRWIREITSANPAAELEIVLYARAVDLVVKNRSAYESTITQLASNKNVRFRICAIAMKNHNIDVSQLIAGVEPVPDGIYEIISKEKQGWGYIKATH